MEFLPTLTSLANLAHIYKGFNQNPGEDRVVFDQNGVYLGIATRRTNTQITPLSYWVTRYHWGAPTNGYGQWDSPWINTERGFRYSGTPPDGIDGYERPARWNIPSNQRAAWYVKRAISPPFQPLEHLPRLTPGFQGEEQPQR